MKSIVLIFVLLFVISTNGNAQDTIKANKINHNNYLNLSLGGGARGFAMGISYFYQFIGIEYSMTFGNAKWFDEGSSDYDKYLDLYNNRSTQKKELGRKNFELLLKIPTFDNLYLNGSVGYFVESRVDVTTYTDSVFPQRSKWSNMENYNTGISYGIGFLYDVSQGTALGLNYKSPIGGMILIGFSF